jgi:hypothetical protein
MDPIYPRNQPTKTPAPSPIEPSGKGREKKPIITSIWPSDTPVLSYTLCSSTISTDYEHLGQTEYPEPCTSQETLVL